MPFPRQALHAQALGFVHPMTGQRSRVEAPMPDDLAGLIAVLRHRYGQVAGWPRLNDPRSRVTRVMRNARERERTT